MRQEVFDVAAAEAGALWRGLGAIPAEARHTALERRPVLHATVSGRDLFDVRAGERVDATDVGSGTQVTIDGPQRRISEPLAIANDPYPETYPCATR